MLAQCSVNYVIGIIGSGIAMLVKNGQTSLAAIHQIGITGNT
jgi:hypothetical protein